MKIFAKFFALSGEKGDVADLSWLHILLAIFQKSKEAGVQGFLMYWINIPSDQIHQAIP